MSLTVLGRRSGMPADGEASSGYLVETRSGRILLDCGPGIATALSAVVHPSVLDAVVISHLHSDHCYDLLPIGKMLLSGRVHFPGGPDPTVNRTDPVRLLVPAGATERLERWAGLFPVRSHPILDKAFEVAFDVDEYRPGQRFRIADCQVHLGELAHVEPNCGARIENEAGTLVYSGDTGFVEQVIDLADGADVLLAEATLSEPDRSGHGHLCGADAGRIASKAGVGRLVLTHFAATDEKWLRDLESAARAEFDGPVDLAEPGMAIAIQPSRQELTEKGRPS